MKDYTISISDKNNGIMAVVGHVGVGHVHSHSSFVQDDSAGFAVVAAIMRRAFKVDTTIESVTGDLSSGSITVETCGGGRGVSHARRGLTPYELELLQRAVGEDGIYTQALAVKTFGRMYGQGVTETPVALQGAAALAILDSFHKKYPEKIHATSEKYEGRIDKMAGAVVDIDGIPVSLLLNINGSEGGIGPDEDNEGNTAIGQKADIMKMLGMDSVPNIIVESKAYMPGLSKEITRDTFLFRAQEGIDDLNTAKALANAASLSGLPYILKTDSLPMVKDSLKLASQSLAKKIADLGTSLMYADLSKEKVSIIADIARLISEDAGGISFMSNSLHDTVRSAGIVPGTASIISLLVPEDYVRHWKIPVLNEEDVNKYIEIILSAIVGS